MFVRSSEKSLVALSLHPVYPKIAFPGLILGGFLARQCSKK